MIVVSITFNFNNYLRARILRPPNKESQALSGAHIKDLKWKQVKTPNLETAHFLLRACVVSVCNEKDQPNFDITLAQNMEFDLNFILKKVDGRSYYEFKSDSMKSTPVDDWLPCP